MYLHDLNVSEGVWGEIMWVLGVVSTVDLLLMNCRMRLNFYWWDKGGFWGRDSVLACFHLSFFYFYSATLYLMDFRWRGACIVVGTVLLLIFHPLVMMDNNYGGTITGHIEFNFHRGFCLGLARLLLSLLNYEISTVNFSLVLIQYSTSLISLKTFKSLFNYYYQILHKLQFHWSL